MNGIIVFLEFREDAEYFTDTIVDKLVAGTYQVIVLDDDAVFHLSNKGISFIHIEELLSPFSEGKLCGQIWQRLEAFCGYVDSVLTDQLDFLEKNAPYLIAQVEVLKIIFDALILKIEVLCNVFERMRPQEIYFPRNDLVQPSHHRLFFDESFSLYSVLIETKLLKIAGYIPKVRTWQSRYKLGTTGGRGNHSKWWYRVARAFAHIAVSLRQPLAKINTTAPIACVIGGGERSLSYVVNSIRVSGIQLLVWRPQTLLAPAPVGTIWSRSFRVVKNAITYRHYQAKLEKVWQALIVSPRFLSYFNWRDVDFSSIILERIHTALTSNIAHQQVIVSEAKMLLPKIDILLSSYYSSFERPIAYLAQRFNKKVVSVQHGAMGHDEGGYGCGLENDPLRVSNKHFFYTDMANVEIKLTWGEQTAAQMSGWRFNKKHHPRLEVIGAPHLQHLKGIRSNSKSTEKRILFVSNAIGNNTYTIMNIRGFAYRKRQYEILRVLASHSTDHKIIYKAYSYWNRNEVYSLIRSQFVNKSIIHCDGEKSLLQLFKEVDCVVMDLPTTGFYEACVTDLPVFLFNVACEFSASVKAAIKRRAYYSENLEEFCSMLNAYQTKPEDFPALNDDTFIKAFCDVDKKTDIMALLSISTLKELTIPLNVEHERAVSYD